jgi:hypothetical protein
MQNLIPDRLAVSSEKKSAPAPTQPQIYQAAWLAPQPSPAAPAQQEDSPARPGVPWGVPEPKLAPGSEGDLPPDPGLSESTFADRFTPSEAAEPYVPLFAPDLRVPFSIRKNPFNPFVRPR